MNFDKIKKDKKNNLLGCMGSKKMEYDRYLKDIILNNINKDTIFIEPFCGSAIISYYLYISNNIKCHINDIDKIRIEFYNNCKDINYMNKINENIMNVKNKDDFDKLIDRKKIMIEYNSYIYSRLINSFRYGLYDENRKQKILNLNWCPFLNDCIITNDEWYKIVEKYKDNENAFIYFDPPYMNSHNGYYSSFDKAYDEKYKKIDNTKVYIDILNYLKCCKCKILFSINNNAITNHIYKDYIKNNYNHNYSLCHTTKDKNFTNNENILIISNF
jgi:site-specific DNA-adenine methylase